MSKHELSNNAADGPDVDGAGVLLPGQDDLGRPVPSSGNVIGQDSVCRLQLLDVSSGKTEVADLQIAVRVDEQVARLEVPVVDAGRVDVLEPAKNLVKEKLHVVVGQRLARLNDDAKIGFH